MAKINLEIIEYIQNSDLDDNMKNFFINVIIYEIRNKGVFQYKDNYKRMIENAVNGD